MNHDAPYFDDLGQPVPVTGFCYPDEGEREHQGDCGAVREETINRLLEVLITGTGGDPAQIGRRALLLAYDAQFEQAPETTMKGLGKLFGVSPQRVHQLLMKLREEMGCLRGDGDSCS